MFIHSKSTDNQQQLRKVAIFVATLDEALADQLLADLPAREAAAVRKLVADLEEIDPAEQQAVLAAFRQGLPASPPQQSKPVRTQVEGVELDASLLARLDAEEDWDSLHTPARLPSSQKCDWQTLSETDATTLVEMLSAEQPQTIAIVLSRLQTARAAELVGKLSPTLQTEVLERLVDLDPADEQTLEVVASQLAEWLAAQNQRHQRMAAGRELVQRILQETPDSQRTVLLTQLGKRSPELAEELAVIPQENQATEPVVTNQLQTSLPAAATPDTYSAPTRTSQRPVSRPPAPVISEQTPTDDPLSELERLDEQALLTALQQADRQTVMLALTGVSEPLMKRILRDLPRRQAKQFRQQVREIGPTRLCDIMAAQRELVRIGLESTT